MAMSMATTVTKSRQWRRHNNIRKKTNKRMKFSADDPFQIDDKRRLSMIILFIYLYHNWLHFEHFFLPSILQSFFPFQWMIFVHSLASQSFSFSSLTLFFYSFQIRLYPTRFGRPKAVQLTVFVIFHLTLHHLRRNLFAKETRTHTPVRIDEAAAREDESKHSITTSNAKRK